jgi:hypothetical protein
VRVAERSATRVVPAGRMTGAAPHHIKRTPASKGPQLGGQPKQNSGVMVNTQAPSAQQARVDEPARSCKESGSDAR